jgi:pilus retraction protein PilT
MLNKFTDLIVTSARNGYSDLHITGAQPLVCRKNGNLLFDQANRWTYQEVDNLVKKIINKKQMEMLRRRLSVDFATSLQNIRLRINIFNSIQGLSLAIRLLPGSVPTFDMLNLHLSLQEISELKSGLVLICGTTGCGKTTTIASILDEINRNRAAHIITIEDPIEYRIKSQKSFVEQREIGPHVPSIERGLIDVMREDPDVVMVGELRDPQTIIRTLDSAEAGHLVIGTLHATNTEDAIYRIINSAPLEAEEHIRYQLASTLAWIIVQQLVYVERIGYRVPLLSILRGTQQIKGLIREKKIFQFENAMHTGKTDGMFTNERYLKEFINAREKFNDPTTCFKPSEEIVPDSVYRSPIFDLDLYQSTLPEMEYSEDAEKTHGGRRYSDKRKLKETLTGMDNFDNRYEIDESQDLEEIIAATDASLILPKKNK